MATIKNVKGEVILGEPKCPECNALGVGYFDYMEGENPHVKAYDYGKPPFVIVYCNRCGHVYNVIPYIVETPSREDC